MSQIVSSKLGRLELSEPDSTEKAAISTCLDSVLEVVSNDLAAASKSADVCKSLQALLDIFDEVSGYQEDDLDEVIAGFHRANGFHHLGCYLSKLCATSDFPQFGAISTMLRIFHRNREARLEKDSTASNVDMSRNDANSITDEVILHLLSLDDEHFTHCSDDAIEIFKLVENISATLSNHRPYSIHIYFETYREFVLKLMKSSNLATRLASWA